MDIAFADGTDHLVFVISYILANFDRYNRRVVAPDRMNYHVHNHLGKSNHLDTLCKYLEYIFRPNNTIHMPNNKGSRFHRHHILPVELKWNDGISWRFFCVMDHFDQ